MNEKRAAGPHTRSHQHAPHQRQPAAASEGRRHEGAARRRGGIRRARLPARERRDGAAHRMVRAEFVAGACERRRVVRAKLAHPAAQHMGLRGSNSSKQQ